MSVEDEINLWCAIGGKDGFKIGGLSRSKHDLDDLRARIYNRRINTTFAGSDDNCFYIWKLKEAVPRNPADTLGERIQALGDLPDIATKLSDDGESIADAFPETIKPGHVSIVVQLRTDLAPPPLEHPAELAHKKALKFAQEARAPSSAAASAKIYKSEQEKYPIYNGRPGDRRGPPIAIYHSAFAELKDMLKDSMKVHDEDEVKRVENTAKLILKSTPIYATEKERGDAIYEILADLLEVGKFKGLKGEQGGKKATESDFGVQEDIQDPSFGRRKAPVVVGELKNELGVNGQCGAQNAFTLRKFLAVKEETELRDTTCCPCITVSIAGPYITFGGAVFAEVFAAEAFTDYIYLGEQPLNKDRILPLSRTFAAVAQAIKSLRRFYSHLQLSATPDVHRLLPNPTYYDNKEPEQTLIFDRRFVYEGRRSDNYRRSLFSAKYGHKDVLVKFCETYHGNAHQKVAEAGFAPELFFCEKIKGGATMVIMELVKARDAHNHFLHLPLPENVMNDVKSGLDILHDAGLVFGDLRRPNILIKKKGDGSERALLIDFEWVGLDNQARYPPSLNDTGEIPWTDGVKPYGIMKQEHDLDMFRKLRKAEVVSLSSA